MPEQVWKIGDYVQPMDQEDLAGKVTAVEQLGESYRVQLDGDEWYDQDELENAE
jgi:hypothetical protein